MNSTASYPPPSSRRWRRSPGACGPCRSIQRRSAAGPASIPVSTLPDQASKAAPSRGTGTGKRRMRTPSSSPSPAGKWSAQVR